jgi:Co/Zn/Cd efflux system component
LCVIDRSVARPARARHLAVGSIALPAALRIEFGAGIVARSTALMADSVDMLGDALVYALSLMPCRAATDGRRGLPS